MPIEIARELCKAHGDPKLCEDRFDDLCEDRITVTQYFEQLEKLNKGNETILTTIANCKGVLTEKFGSLDRFVDQIVEEEGVLDE